MFKFVIVSCIVAFVQSELDSIPERKNVVELSRESGNSGARRLLGSGSGKWSTDTDTTDDGVCGCSSYLDDSSSADSWSSGKKTSSSGKKNRRRRLGKSSSGKWSTDTTDCDGTWSSGKKNSASGSGKWSTGTGGGGNPCSTTEAPFEDFCDCLCACEDGNTATYNHQKDEETTRRRLGKSSSGSNKWSTDTTYTTNGCGGDSWSSGKKTSSSGKKNRRRRLGKSSSGKWSTDTDDEPCSTTQEPFETTTITCQCASSTETPLTTNVETTTATEEEATTTEETIETDDPTPSPTPDPTPDPTPNPSNNPTDSPSNNPTENPTEKPTSSPSVMPTPRCEENTDYIVLGFGWEYYLASLDETLIFTGQYNQNGAQFDHITKDYSIWWESVGTDHAFVVGDQSDVRKQLYYKDLVSTWTDDDNPLTDSDDESEWESGDESAEFVTSNMTIFDCDGNNLGTDVYTQYSHIYYGSAGVKARVSALTIVSIATIFAVIFG